MSMLYLQISSKVKKCLSVLDAADWKKYKFWEKMFLYFCLMSVLGKIFEIFFWHLNPTTIIPFAQTYGFGAIAVIYVRGAINSKKVSQSIFCLYLKHNCSCFSWIFECSGSSSNIRPKHFLGLFEPNFEFEWIYLFRSCSFIWIISNDVYIFTLSINRKII